MSGTEVQGFRSCQTSSGSRGFELPSSSGVQATSRQRFDVRSLREIKADKATTQVSYDYTSLEKFAFKWVPGLQRVYRWYLFYQLDAASLSKGTGSWSSALRKTHTEVRPPPPSPSRILNPSQTQRLITYLQAKAPAKYLSILTPTYRTLLPLSYSLFLTNLLSQLSTASA